MTAIDTVFTRLLLKERHTEVRKQLRTFHPDVNVWKAASVTCSKLGSQKTYFVEIDVPNLYRLNWSDRAFNAYEARYKAWGAFLEAVNR